MTQQRLRHLLMVLPVVLLMLVGLPTSAAAGPDHRKVVAADDCEPASFNAVFFPGACLAPGRTTVTDFLAQVTASGQVKGWDFSRDEFDIDPGGRITVVNKGGEFHSFTEVADFSHGGCLPGLNNGLPVNTICPADSTDLPAIFAVLAPTGIDAGKTVTFKPLSPGVHHFQCLIHPWMQSTAIVED